MTTDNVSRLYECLLKFVFHFLTRHHFLFQIWYSFVYSVPSYVLTGQPLELSRFAMFVLVLAAVTVLADAIGNVIGTLVNPIVSVALGLLWYPG